ncbi:TPA: hypothetical protein ACPVWX_004686 [Vibrio parahaemolyticus]
MSLKEIMKLRMTISRQTVIHSVSIEECNDSSDLQDKVVKITRNIEHNQDFSVQQWREKLEEKLKEAELSFHYNDN